MAVASRPRAPLELDSAIERIVSADTVCTEQASPAFHVPGMRLWAGITQLARLQPPLLVLYETIST